MKTNSKATVFPRSELTQMLEAISIFWHRHGSSEEQELVEYLQLLHEALPKDIPETVRKPDRNRMPVLLKLEQGDFEREIGDALKPTFSAKEAVAEVEFFRRPLMQAGKVGADNRFEIGKEDFVESVDGYFNSDSFSEEIVERIAVARDRLIELSAS